MRLRINNNRTLSKERSRSFERPESGGLASAGIATCLASLDFDSRPWHGVESKRLGASMVIRSGPDHRQRQQRVHRKSRIVQATTRVEAR